MFCTSFGSLNPPRSLVQWLLLVSQELAAIKARVQELEMEEEMERLKEEERCEAQEMQLLASSPRLGETLSILRFISVPIDPGNRSVVYL